MSKYQEYIKDLESKCDEIENIEKDCSEEISKVSTPGYYENYIAVYDSVAKMEKPRILSENGLLYHWIKTNLYWFFKENKIDIDETIKEQVEKDFYKLEMHYITFKNYKVLKYFIATDPAVRKAMEEIYGKELLAVFPNYTEMKKELTDLISFGKAILERKKVEKQTDEELKKEEEEKAIPEIDENIENYQARLKEIEDAINDNGIYTTENHPTYQSVKKERDAEEVKKSNELDRISNLNVSKLREEKLSNIEDYEGLNEFAKRSNEVSDAVASFRYSHDNKDEYISRIEERINHLEKNIQTRNQNYVKENLDDKLELIASIRKTEEYKDYSKIREELVQTSRSKTKAESEYKEANEAFNRMNEANDLYSRMNFIKKHSAEGKAIKDKYTNEVMSSIIEKRTKTEEEVKRLKQEEQRKTSQFRKLAEAISEIALEYGIEINAQENGFWWVGMQLERKEQSINDTIEMNNQIIQDNEKDNKEIQKLKELLKDVKYLSMYEDKMQEHGNKYFEHLAKAINLINESPEFENEEIDVVVEEESKKSM